MFQKKRIVPVVLTLCMLTGILSGCTDISGTSSSRTAVEMEEASTEVATTASPEEESAESTAAPEESDAVSTAATEAVSETHSESSVKSSDDSAPIGDTGMTAAEWCTEAQRIYTTAASTYFTYLCSSGGFTYDPEDTTEDGWTRITSCESIEEAEAEYYSVFAQTGHETDLDSQFRMVDEKLYRLCGDRGMDITYLSSQVTALTNSTDDTLTFSVVSTYEDPDTAEQSTKEDVFTLFFERGVWRVGQFTMPY